MKSSTLVLGATPNPQRYAFIATLRLLAAGQQVELVGIKQGEIGGLPIQQGQPPLDNVDTVTLYLGARHQPGYYDYILSLQPRRVIFNPGTENPELVQLLRENAIEPIIACTLVMLASGEYTKHAA